MPPGTRKLPNRTRLGIMGQMKRFVVVLLVLFCAVVCGRAQGLDDEYVQIFRQIQEADSLSTTAPSQALAKYLDAQAALDRLHKGSPDWNTRIVNYRLSYLADKIATLSPANSNPAPNESKTASPGNTAQRPPATTAADALNQLNELQQRFGQVQSDNALLQAKLKEALAMRPAAVDPAALAKAQETIKTLQKENELLKVEKEHQAAPVAVDSKTSETAQHQLTEANRQLADQSARLNKLAFERDTLEARLKSSSAENTGTANLRAEIEVLKKQLADRPAVRVQPDQTSTQQVAKLDSDKETLRVENLALQNRIKQLSASSAAGNTADKNVADSGRVQQLEADRDRLQRELDALNKEKSGHKSKSKKGQVDELESQLATARTTLEVLEAKAVPYSAEELELLKRSEGKLSSAEAKKKSMKELPAGAAALVAEAQRSFAAKQFDKAEASYQQVLQQNPDSVPVLANLAAIQVEEKQYEPAESNIRKALKLEPDDSYSLYVLGLLKLGQSKYDEAIDALSQAAKLDPQNAEVQNYLGLALSEKGLRVPAEAALRKAVQLQPGYAGAHYNLAVVYATEHPPATELARWHYQKALAAGVPRNADLEKRFEVHP
jgi:Flp pilus assembly protein TadD